MKFTHGEAFKVMTYVCEGPDEHIEEIWNTRDGVTPFIVDCRACPHSSVHKNWHADREALDHVPVCGDRVFMDLTRERAIELATDKVNKNWEHAQYPISRMFPDKETAVMKFATSYLDIVGTPDIVVVDDFWYEVFKTRASMQRTMQDIKR